MFETWFLMGVVVLSAALAAWFFRGTVPVFVTCIFTAVTLHSVIKMQIGAAACERLGQDKQNGTLEVLLATPLSVKEIVRGQWLALIRQFAAPAVAVVLVSALTLAIVIIAHEREFFDAPDAATNCVVFFVLATLVLGADIVALGWVGIWQALACRQLAQARSQAVFLVLLLPWAVLILVVTFIALHQPPGFGAMHLASLWFILGLLSDLSFTLGARRRIYGRFRIMATERFQPGTSDRFWGKPWGAVGEWLTWSSSPREGSTSNHPPACG